MLSRIGDVAKAIYFRITGAPRARVRHSVGENGAHSVALGIRVWIFKDGQHFVAQGLDIDYASCGATLREVQDHFSAGLMATVTDHLEEYGDLHNLVRPAPSDVWIQFFQSIRESRENVRTESRPLPNAAFTSISTPILPSVEFVEPLAAA